MGPKREFKRHRSNWRAEVDSAYLYERMAQKEKNVSLAEVFKRLSECERKHADFWLDKMLKTGYGRFCARERPSFRARLLSLVAVFFGPRFVVPVVAAGESINQDSYKKQPETEATELPAQERSHARVLRMMAQQSQGAGLEGSVLAGLEGRHGFLQGNALRAAVLGVNDGLVSNLSLMMGVSGAQVSGHGVLIAGMAGLLAGACSMAMGEWLSVQSSRELSQRQIQAEAEELAEHPEEERQELSLIYQSKGIPKEEADRLSVSLMKDRGAALKTLSREELGIDPESLGGSAWEAAGTSFVLFISGALIPLVPFFFMKGTAAIGTSLFFGATGLFLSGMAIALFTGRPAIVSGLRQLLIGLAAAGITYEVGRLLGVAIAG